MAPLYSPFAAVSEVSKVGIDWNLGLGVRFGASRALNFPENIRGAVSMATAPLFMHLVVWGEEGPSDGPYMWRQSLVGLY